ncbi:hypothetical protein [Komagataeibacter saccharivorans]|uniref:hypothetical protein n=1 Tax=Komagataeibacter saccharivorans TaxID=265959 RepID=UPI000C81A5D3|nr:hypothetical protein [Komagataeibacter saccharivorans]
MAEAVPQRRKLHLSAGTVSIIVIDTCLPRRTEVAVAGVQLWEKHPDRETSKVVSIAATRGRLG